MSVETINLNTSEADIATVINTSTLERDKDPSAEASARKRAGRVLSFLADGVKRLGETTSYSGGQKITPEQRAAIIAQESAPQPAPSLEVIPPIVGNPVSNEAPTRPNTDWNPGWGTGDTSQAVVSVTSTAPTAETFARPVTVEASGKPLSWEAELANRSAAIPATPEAQPAVAAADPEDLTKTYGPF